MRKAVAIVLTLLLTASMLFAITPTAYANAQNPNSFTENAHSSNEHVGLSDTAADKSTPAPHAAASAAESTQAPEPGFEAGQSLSFDTADTTSAPNTTEQESELAPSDSSNRPDAEISLEATLLTNEKEKDGSKHAERDKGKDKNDPDPEEPKDPGGTGDAEPPKKLEQLYEALGELQAYLLAGTTLTIRSVPNAILNEDYFNTDDLSVTFTVNAISGQLNSLLHRINNLLKQNDLPYAPGSIGLAVEIVDGMPEGFSYEGNTLTLTDPTLLYPSEELGDVPGAILRFYNLKLRLYTGISYVDAWLAEKGIEALAFRDITLYVYLNEFLSQDPGGEDENPGDDEGGEDPGDDDDPDNGNDDEGPGDGDSPGDDEPGNDGSTTDQSNDPQGDDPVTAFIPTASVATIPDLAEALVPEPPTPEPLSEPSDEGQPAQELDLLETIEDLQVPMASMMTNDDNGLVAANAGLATFSLVVAGASLVFSRGRKPGGAQTLMAALQLSPVVKGIGYLSIGLGACSPILFILSQSLSSSILNASIVWTPLLATIAILQVACGAILFFGTRLTAKKTRPRFRIRF